jgi:hypothetical protein
MGCMTVSMNDKVAREASQRLPPNCSAEERAVHEMYVLKAACVRAVMAACEGKGDNYTCILHTFQVVMMAGVSQVTGRKERQLAATVHMRVHARMSTAPRSQLQSGVCLRGRSCVVQPTNRSQR